MTTKQMDRDTIADELRALKEGALRATREHDVAYYDGYCADDSVAILPFGMFDKAEVLAQVAQPQPSFRARSIDDEHVVVLSTDCGLVTYTARYPERRVAVSTLFLRRDGRWQAVLYQQTELLDGGSVTPG